MKKKPNCKCPKCGKIFYSIEEDDGLGGLNSTYCGRKCAKADGLSDEELDG